MKKYILNKHIRYREEDGYILLCDCKRLIDYVIPLKYFNFLNSLQEGVLTINIKKSELTLLEDLCSLKIALKKGDNESSSREDILRNLSYKDSEFV